MSDDELARLEGLKSDIYGNYGLWGASALALACSNAAAEPLLDGDARLAIGAAEAHAEAARSIEDAMTAMADIERISVDGVWIGTARNAAADLLKVIGDDLARARDNYRAIAGHLLDYAERLPPPQGDDATGQAVLGRARQLAEDQVWGGSVPKFAGYDGDAMHEAHQAGMHGIDVRTEAHTRAKANSVSFNTAMWDIAGRARSWAMTGGGLTHADRLMLAGAGGDQPILTLAMDQRAAGKLAGLSPGDRDRLSEMLAGAKSPEQRAYLMKALAAGYSMDDIAGFDAMIGPHGHDRRWLAAHLSPLTMDGDPFEGTRGVSFGRAPWTQGEDPTCVPSSIIAARAQVDPLYALQLTTGGHPGDPGFDTPEAFAKRLHDEQTQTYDETRADRSWWDRQFNSHGDGLNDQEGLALSNENIAAHTGATYHDVPMADQQARADTLPAVERAVDNGYPVPLTVRDPEGHALMVIGHSDGQLQIYNPWGSTFWVSEAEFVSGDVNNDEPGIPDRPTSVRLPQEAK